LIIEFNNMDIQNAIYTIACENEYFETDNDLDYDTEKDMMKYYWGEVEKRGNCEYGLENAISDYLLIQGEFDVDKGKYGWIINLMECEVFGFRHCERD